MVPLAQCITRLFADVVRGIWESFRETLPDSEETASAFVSGMAWAFAIFFTLLILVTWLSVKTTGLL